MSRAVKRTVMALVVIGAGGFAAMNPGAVRAFYLDLYPSDPAKRQALDLCFLQDHKFNRLDSGEREACYRHMLVATSEVSSGGSETRAEASTLDLQRAAGQGRMPLNDIRRIEQTQDAIHAPR